MRINPICKSVWQSVRGIAADWTETPSLIVTSPFLRTQQTAAPTI